MTVVRKPSGAGPVIQLVSGMMYGGGQRVAEHIVVCGRAGGNGRDAALWLLGDRFLGRFEVPPDKCFPYQGDYRRVLRLIRLGHIVASAMHREGSTVVHTHGWDADVVGAVATWVNRGSHLVHQHVMPEWMVSGSLRHQVRRGLTRWLLSRKRTRIVAVSEAVANYLSRHIGYPEARITVIHNGVDTATFVPAPRKQDSPNGVLVVGAVSRLVPGKGLGILIDAVKRARELYPLTLRIAGTGPDEDLLRRQASQQGVPVEFVGHVTNMPEFYASVDVFVLPSVSNEGLPLSVSEAMACGLPVIGTDVGGTGELVVDGRTGFLCRPGDPESIAERLKSLFHSRDLREDLGRAARYRVHQKFSMDRFCARINQLHQNASRGL